MSSDVATRIPDAVERRLERLGMTGNDDEWAERYVLCDQLVDPKLARPRQQFEAIAHALRDLLAQRWIKTRQTRERENPKRVYYLSMEFLIGRTLTNNMVNLMAEPVVQKLLERQGLDFHRLAAAWHRQYKVYSSRQPSIVGSKYEPFS